MRLDRGIIFLAFAGLLSIVLIVALAAAVVTGPPQPAPGLSSSDDNQSPLLGDTANLPEPAQPAFKTANYPGISRSYTCEKIYSMIILDRVGTLCTNSGYVTDLILNDDGTVTVTVKHVTIVGLGLSYADYTVTGGHWYKIKGKGHSFYLDARFTAPVSYPEKSASLYVGISPQIVDLYNVNGQDAGNQIDNGYTEGSFVGSAYNSWDAGYATMSIPADSLAPFIDACVPADVARPFIQKGYTGEQAVPYIYYNMPLETADYFKSRGISGELCGPYYAAGVSREDILAYLDSGYTADQIMPYVHAGVPESDVLTYLDAGYTYDKVAPFINAGVTESDIMTYLGAGLTYDKAKPYIGMNASAAIAAPYAASTYTLERCLPFVNASIGITKARPFLLLNIPSDQAVIYIQNSISATTAKPYVDAGVQAGKAVDEIKKGIPPTK